MYAPYAFASTIVCVVLQLSLNVADVLEAGFKSSRDMEDDLSAVRSALVSIVEVVSALFPIPSCSLCSGACTLLISRVRMPVPMQPSTQRGLSEARGLTTAYAKLVKRGTASFSTEGGAEVSAGKSCTIRSPCDGKYIVCL